MRPVDPNSFTINQRLEKPLYLNTGVKLMGVGVRITDRNLRMLRRLTAGELLEGEPTASDAARFRSLHTGRSSSRDEWNDGPAKSGAMFDPASSVHTVPFEFLSPSDREIVRSRARRLKNAHEKVAKLFPLWAKLPRRVAPLERGKDAAGRTVWPDRDGQIDLRNRAVRQLAAITRDIVAGGSVLLSELDSLVDEIVDLRRTDPGRFPAYALLRTETEDYLQQHSYTTACLAVATAETLNWDDASVVKAGLAGLVADLGMLHVPLQIRVSNQPLDEFELNRIWRHTEYSVVLLDSIDGLHEEVSRAVYEHHEREDGTGYPRATRAEDISDLAKILGAADAYAAAVYPRPYRPGKTPHEAMAEMVRLTASGRFCREMVAALVRAIGLYPPGSLVRLSNGESARVVACHTEDAFRPIVRLGDHERESSSDRRVDLASPGNTLSIARALPEPGFLANAA